jgi:hypothetical protein
VTGATRHKDGVNAGQDGVNAPSAGLREGPDQPHSERVRSPNPVTRLERCPVADLLYAVLLIGVFVVLALALRGLEKL